MKFLKTDIRVLMLVLVIGSIGGTFAIVQGLDLDYDYKSPSVGAGSMLTGNVKVTQYGPDGDIIAYRQSDNHIVMDGMEIIMSQVFGGINSSAILPDFNALTGTHPVRFMQIGHGGETRLLHNDTQINTDFAPGSGCGRKLSTVTNATGDGPAHGYSLTQGAACDNNFPGPGSLCSAQMNVTATATFLGGAPDNCSGALSIDEAGIFDNSTATANNPAGALEGGLMFARNTFGSVVLGPLDTLQLDWEFTFTDS